MCDVGTAALAVSAVSGGLSAYSQIQTGRANACWRTLMPMLRNRQPATLSTQLMTRHTSNASRHGGLPDSRPPLWLLTAPT